MRDVADKQTLDLFAVELQTEVKANETLPALPDGWRAHWQPWYQHKLQQRQTAIKPFKPELSREFLTWEQYQEWKEKNPESAAGFELTPLFQTVYGKAK